MCSHPPRTYQGRLKPSGLCNLTAAPSASLKHGSARHNDSATIVLSAACHESATSEACVTLASSVRQLVRNLLGVHTQLPIAVMVNAARREAAVEEPLTQYGAQIIPVPSLSVRKCYEYYRGTFMKLRLVLDLHRLRSRLIFLDSDVQAI